MEQPESIRQRHIGLQTWGTDGDILPFLALGHGLAQAGLPVSVAATSVDGKDYTALGESLGIAVHMTAGQAVDSIDLYALTRIAHPFFELKALLQTCYDPFVEAMATASESLCEECDMVIGHPLCHTLLTAAQQTGVQRAVVALSPLTVPTATCIPQGANLGRWANAAIWKLGDRVMTHTLFATACEQRSAAGLPPLSSLIGQLFNSDTLTLLAFSPQLWKTPTDLPSHCHEVGFLNMPSEKMPPVGEDLQRFIASGPPPVYMTFGSCSKFKRDRDLALMAEAARLSGHRAIIQMEGNAPGTLPGNTDVFISGRTDHAAIFPQCAAIVHHGGAGTTQAALLSGRPSVVVAHAYDQPDWGRRLRQAGVAGRTLHRRNATPGQLAKAMIAASGSSEMRSTAEHLSARMRTENGVQTAVRLITGLLG